MYMYWTVKPGYILYHIRENIIGKGFTQEKYVVITIDTEFGYIQEFTGNSPKLLNEFDRFLDTL